MSARAAGRGSGRATPPSGFRRPGRPASRRSGAAGPCRSRRRRVRAPLLRSLARHGRASSAAPRAACVRSIRGAAGARPRAPSPSSASAASPGRGRQQRASARTSTEGPSATTRPRSSSTVRVQQSSTASSRADHQARPGRSPTRWITRRREEGSRLAVGSSRSSTSGRIASTVRSPRRASGRPRDDPGSGTPPPPSRPARAPPALGSGPSPVQAEVERTEGDIVEHGAEEQLVVGVLEDEPKRRRSGTRLRRETASPHTFDRAARGLVEPGEEQREGRLPRRSAHQGHRLPGADRRRNPLQRRGPSG